MNFARFPSDNKTTVYQHLGHLQQIVGIPHQPVTSIHFTSYGRPPHSHPTHRSSHQPPPVPSGAILGTASGRLIANVLASVATYETEIRGERVKAGQAAARAAGSQRRLRCLSD